MKTFLIHFICYIVLTLSANLQSAELQTIRPSSITNHDANGTSYQLVRLDWQDTLKPGDHLTLINPWGDINLRQNAAPQATLHAVMQVIGEGKKTAELQLTHKDDNYRLEFLYPEGQTPQLLTEGRIDTALLIPEGVTVSIESQRGKVASKTIHVPLEITAFDNPVSIKTTSTIKINGQSSDVNLHLLQESDVKNKAIQRAMIKTQSGDVNIHYYPDVSLAFKLLSGQSKTTNDLVLLKSRQLEGRYVLMQHEDATESLAVQTDTGYIRLVNTGAESSDI